MLDGIDILIARKRARLHQYELAASLGLRESRLSEIENGRKAFPVELIPRLRDVLGVHLTTEAGRG